MQFSIRSFESSSICAEENLDWPTRIVDAITSMASARSAFAFFLSGERSENRRTSFVSAAARTAPVKKSPPRRRAKDDWYELAAYSQKTKAYSVMEAC